MLNAVRSLPYCQATTGTCTPKLEPVEQAVRKRQMRRDAVLDHRTRATIVEHVDGTGGSDSARSARLANLVALKQIACRSPEARACRRVQREPFKLKTGSR